MRNVKEMKFGLGKHGLLAWERIHVRHETAGYEYCV